jgi:hypothetical protein
LILRIRDDGSLCVPLGPWLCDPKKYLNHDSYIHQSFDQVIVRGNDDFWKVFRLFNTTMTHFHYQLVDMVSVFNFSLDNFSPSDYSAEEGYISVWRRSLFNTSFPTPLVNSNPLGYESIHSSFQDSLLWYSPFLRHTIFNLPDQCNFDQLIICSDGGVRDDRSGIGIVVAFQQQIISTNHLRIRPSYHVMTSYRCEGFGIVGALVTFQAYKKFYNLPHQLQQLTIITDSEAMVKKISLYRRQSLTKKFFTPWIMILFMRFCS